jgi:hypothetical protein
VCPQWFRILLRHRMPHTTYPFVCELIRCYFTILWEPFIIESAFDCSLRLNSYSSSSYLVY